MKASALALAFALAGAVAAAQVEGDDHSAHHPLASTPGTAAAPAGAASRPTPANTMAQQMKKMQDMHERMLAVKTPQERAALLDEHVKLMQAGMDMMSQMRPAQRGMTGAMGASGNSGPGAAGPEARAQTMAPSGMMGMHEGVERRMAMMEMMMQMMVDWEAASLRR